MKKLFYAGFLVIICMWQNACIAPYDEQVTDITPDYRDSLFRHIHDLKDEQKLDSLYPFLQHQDPTYRYQAAMAFASIRDTSSLDELSLLLQDKIDQVRAAAAFAIGQTGVANAVTILSEAFDQTDTAGQYKLTNRAILEGIGRCGCLLYTSDAADES